MRILEALPRKRATLILLLASMWAAVFLIWWLRRPPRLEVEARNLLEAMQSGDGSVLQHYAFPEEVAANALSPDKLRRVYMEIVIPRLNQLKRSGNMELQNFGDQGVAGYDVATKYGRRFSMSADVYPVDGEIRSPVLRSVFGAWLMDYYSTHDEPFDLLTRNKAIIAGVRADREKLRAIGVVAVSDIDVISGTVTMLPIDSLDTHYERWNASLEKQGRRSP